MITDRDDHDRITIDCACRLLAALGSEHQKVTSRATESPSDEVCSADDDQSKVPHGYEQTVDERRALREQSPGRMHTKKPAGAEEARWRFPD